MSMPDGMPDMPGMPSASPIPTPWMGMPGQTWLGAATAYMGMWVVMMAAMMLPSLVPMLWQYRHSVGIPNGARLGGLTALAGAGYFIVWAVFGIVAYGLGAALAAVETQWVAAATTPANPLAAATGIVVLLAGGFQLSRWKIRQLECCREAAGVAQPLPAGARDAWKYGLRLGAHCTLCCLGLILVLVVTGMTNLGTMVIVAAAITLERLAPRPALIARAAGIVILAAGVLLIARAVGAL